MLSTQSTGSAAYGACLFTFHPAPPAAAPCLHPVPCCVSLHCLQADFVSKGMWDGAITKGMSKQEVALLRAPLVYAEIMSFIKV